MFRASLDEMPSSLASSWTRTLATVLLFWSASWPRGEPQLPRAVSSGP
ncbi:hypothetical protein ACFFX0_24795 [Citricoccus parietis]|uniref:Uncharacterized protein n=1 Tax=Citricoccus parietis TaxID=592307 RepID=A0ABV5G5L7_9MICC